MDDKSYVDTEAKIVSSTITKISSNIEIDTSHALESVFGPVEISLNNHADEIDETEFSKKAPTQN